MLTDDGSRTLRDRLLDETFHSGCGALSECWYVYLLNSGIHDLLLQCPTEPVRVLELGFGTGMGWLITAAAAYAHGAPLHYVSLESRLLPTAVLAQIDTASAVQRAVTDGWIPASLQCVGLIEQAWLAHRQTILDLQTIEHQVAPGNTLQVVQGDGRTWLRSMPAAPFDAIYFDAFSPQPIPSCGKRSCSPQPGKCSNPTADWSATVSTAPCGARCKTQAWSSNACQDRPVVNGR